MEHIVPQSAGSLSVAILALLMAVIQLYFIFLKRQLIWYAWAATGSLSGMFYALGVFLEYNMPPGPVNHFGGVLEFAALVLLVHCFYGFTFEYLHLHGRRYHIIAGTFHAFILILLWSTNLIVADDFVARNFSSLAKPYMEADLGPLGPLFVFYIAGASLGGIILWIKNKPADAKYRTAYLCGFSLWFVLGIHDGLAALGMPAYQYIMEYGFFAFSAVVLWIVFDSYMDVLAEDKYRTITEFANDGIVVLQDGRVVFENPACRNLFGHSLLKTKIEDLAHEVVPEDWEKFTACLSDALILNAKQCSSMIRRKQSERTEQYLEICANKIQYRNSEAILAAIRDITEHVLEERAIRDREEKLARLKKMESIGLLAGGVAHDLNNVLSGIVSYPELMLLNLPQDSSLREPLETIQESGKRAAAIVNDLLTIARGVVIQKQAFNFNDIIGSYLASPEHKTLLLHHPNVEVRTNLDPGLLNIIGSPAHFRKVVMNLVSNAAEAINGNGAVLMTTTNRYLDRPLKGYDNVHIGEYAVLAVEDNGPGISSVDLNRIFEPFYTKKVMGRSGTGLGLTVVWNVVQDHGGYIDVSSSPQGAKFELYFPITRQEIADEKSFISLEHLQGKGEMILVVDDIKSQREISCRMLEALGYNPASVPSGEEAVEYLKHRSIDLLLLDMIMEPGMDGRETFERILKDHPQTRAVVVSGFAETDQVRETLRLGAASFLKKPLLLEDLGLAVKKAFSQ